MADEIDQMQDREDKLLEARVAYRRPAPQPTGQCFNCDEPLFIGVYCDADCRDDHERRDRYTNAIPSF